jgi:hypothetical protein
MVIDPPVPRYIALAMSRHGELTFACRTVMQLTQEIAQSLAMEPMGIGSDAPTEFCREGASHSGP